MAEEQKESLMEASRELKQLKSPETAVELKRNPASNQLLKYFALGKKYRHFNQFQCISAAHRLQNSNEEHN